MLPITEHPPRACDAYGGLVPAQTIRWENSSAARYCEATLQLNLFGEWEVLSVWGRIASPRGGHQCLPVLDIAAGVALLANVSERRDRRGYARSRV